VESIDGGIYSISSHLTDQICILILQKKILAWVFKVSRWYLQQAGCIVYKRTSWEPILASNPPGFTLECQDTKKNGDERELLPFAASHTVSTYRLLMSDCRSEGENVFKRIQEKQGSRVKCKELDLTDIKRQPSTAGIRVHWQCQKKCTLSKTKVFVTDAVLKNT